MISIKEMMETDLSVKMRWAGAGLILGGLLFFGRMAPIFAVLPEDLAFPPETTEDLIRLQVIAGVRWTISHLMGLVSVGLLATGYWIQASALAAVGHKIVGRAAALIAAAAFGLFAIALVIDGFLVFNLAVAYSAGGSGAPGLPDVQAMHDRALLFFTPAVFLMFVAIGVLSSRMLHRHIHSRWLGGLGMAIAVTAITAYLFGVTGPNWDNLQIGGSLMMLGFLWHVLMGFAALFGRGVRQ